MKKQETGGWGKNVPRQPRFAGQKKVFLKYQSQLQVHKMVYSMLTKTTNSGGPETVKITFIVKYNSTNHKNRFIFLKTTKKKDN